MESLDRYVASNRSRSTPAERSIAGQLRAASAASAASTHDLNIRNAIDSLPQAVWNCRRFVSDEAISKKGSRGRRSWIKNEGIFVREVLANGIQGKTSFGYEATCILIKYIGEAYWVCRRCDKNGALDKLYIATATSGASLHLKIQHRLAPPNDDEDSEALEAPDFSQPPPKRHRSAPTVVPKSQVSRIRELCVGFLVDSSSPFTTFQNLFLKALLYQLNPDVCAQVPWSRQSQKEELGRLYKEKKTQIKDEMNKALTKVHLSFDLWTSPNRHAIIAIFCHFLKPSGQLTQYLLALRRQLGAHTGENIAHTMLKVIKEWDLVESTGSVVCDNATNNDTCLQTLFPLLSLIYTKEDVVHRRMRCYGHILNLVGRAFLHGVDKEAFEQESDDLINAGRLKEDLALWRTRGPIGKLRNIVKYIRSSPQRCESFLAISNEVEDGPDAFTLFEESPQELQLVLSNDTRWNSTYMMIKRALDKRSQVTTFMFNNRADDGVDEHIPDEDALTNEDWHILIEVKEVLEPLYLQTMRCQGWGKADGHGRLWEVLAGMEYLIDRLEEWKKFYDEPTEEEIEVTATQLNQSQSQSSTGKRRSRQAAPPQTTTASQKPSVNSIPLHVRDDYTPRQRLAALQRHHKGHFDSRGYFRLSVLNAWQVLNKYYTKLGESPLYTAAVILHPGRGLRWLEKRWNGTDQRDWLHQAKNGLYDYWKQWYRDEAITTPSPPPSQGVFTSLSTTSTTEDCEFGQWLNDRADEAAVNEASELDKYFGMSITQPVGDPVQWWIQHRQTFPTLSKLALDVLAIPAMATDCERAFSLAKLTLTSQRLSMRPTTLEESQCLQNWLRDGCVTVGGQYFAHRDR